MKFENTQVTGFENAILGARLPMCKDLSEAKEKSDSFYNDGERATNDYVYGDFVIGEKDLDLLQRLIKADNKIGQPNAKYLRMIHCQVAITAPLYWWKEMDTYKVGTTANSTSTMHRILNYPITEDCFEESELLLGTVVRDLEILRKRAIETKDKNDWKKLIVNLPESWLQTRMFDCDYATLRNIYCWRKNHKLTEWHTFCEWVESLPYASELITDKNINIKLTKEEEKEEAFSRR